MSVLIVNVGENRFAIDCRYILQVLPWIGLKKVPHSASYLAGLLNLGGEIIPVVDFCSLIENREADPSFHTRIVLLEETVKEGEKHQLGIIAEKVFAFMPCEKKDFTETDFRMQSLPYLKAILTDSKGVVQYIDIEEFFKMLSPELFRPVTRLTSA